MDVHRGVIRVHNKSFDVCRAEMEHARFMVIDPNDGMIVMLAHGIGPFWAISGSLEPANARLFDERTNVSGDVLRLAARQRHVHPGSWVPGARAMIAPIVDRMVDAGQRRPAESQPYC